MFRRRLCSVTFRLSASTFDDATFERQSDRRDERILYFIGLLLTLWLFRCADMSTLLADMYFHVVQSCQSCTLQFDMSSLDFLVTFEIFNVRMMILGMQSNHFTAHSFLELSKLRSCRRTNSLHATFHLDVQRASRPRNSIPLHFSLRTFWPFVSDFAPFRRNIFFHQTLCTAFVCRHGFNFH